MADRDFIEKFIERLDRVDGSSVQSLLIGLIREKGFAERVFNSIFEGIVVLDESATVLFYNRAAQDMLGWAPGAMLGERVGEGWVRDMAEECFADRESSSRVQVTVERGNVFDISTVPLDDDGGRPVGAVLIFRDISGDRRWSALRTAMEKTKVLAALAAGVAHEIGNPLSSLDLYMQLIERELGKLGGEEALTIREYVNIAKDEIGRLDDIVKQFLRAVRPLRPNMAFENPNEIVESTVRFMKHEIAKKGGRVITSMADGLPPIFVDRAQLRQAFFNIIKNALQAMPGGGELRIATESRSGEVLISFTDTGWGIREEDRDRIFEPYFTTREDGSGLGLLIVQKIIEANGGSIGAENVTAASSGEKGTRFTVRFPEGGRPRRMLPERQKPTAV